MVEKARLIKISKFISKYLRHEPEKLGLTLLPGGWVDIDDLIQASAKHGFVFTRQELDQVVATNDKQRFSFDESGTQIRANQGHSVEIDLQLEPTTPPDILYHGTAEHSVEAILRDGAKKMSRNHVHLSRDYETAKKVGARHGKPAVLMVDAAKMNAAGILFYVSDNGVWLVDHVPAEYLARV